VAVIVPVLGRRRRAQIGVKGDVEKRSRLDQEPQVISQLRDSGGVPGWTAGAGQIRD